MIIHLYTVLEVGLKNIFNSSLGDLRPLICCCHRCKSGDRRCSPWAHETLSHVLAYRSRSRSSTSLPAAIRCCAGSVLYIIQRRKHVLDYADYTAPTRQHELDHGTDQELSALQDLDHGMRTDYLSYVWTFSTESSTTTRQEKRAQGKTIPGSNDEVPDTCGNHCL